MSAARTPGTLLGRALRRSLPAEVGKLMSYVPSVLEPCQPLEPACSTMRKVGSPPPMYRSSPLGGSPPTGWRPFCESTGELMSAQSSVSFSASCPTGSIQRSASIAACISPPNPYVVAECAVIQSAAAVAAQLRMTAQESDRSSMMSRQSSVHTVSGWSDRDTAAEIASQPLPAPHARPGNGCFAAHAPRVAGLEGCDSDSAVRRMPLPPPRPATEVGDCGNLAAHEAYLPKAETHLRKVPASVLVRPPPDSMAEGGGQMATVVGTPILPLAECHIDSAGAFAVQPPLPLTPPPLLPATESESGALAPLAINSVAPTAVVQSGSLPTAHGRHDRSLAESQLPHPLAAARCDEDLAATVAIPPFLPLVSPGALRCESAPAQARASTPPVPKARLSLGRSCADIAAPTPTPPIEELPDVERMVELCDACTLADVKLEEMEAELVEWTERLASIHRANAKKLQLAAAPRRRRSMTEAAPMASRMSRISEEGDASPPARAGLARRVGPAASDTKAALGCAAEVDQVRRLLKAVKEEETLLRERVYWLNTIRAP